MTTKVQLSEHTLDSVSPVTDVKIIPVRHYSERHQAFAPHRHSFYEVVFIERGEGYQEIDFRAFPTQGQFAYLILPGQVHRLQEGSVQQGSVMLFNACLLEAPLNADLTLLTQLHRQPFVNFGTVEREDLIAPLMVLERELARPHPSPLILKLAVNLYLLQFKRLHERLHVPLPSPTGRETYLQFLWQVEHSYQQHLSVEHYAGQFHLTAKRLNEIVKAASGRTAKQVLQQRLLTEARRQLLFSSVNVKAIADSLGFESPYYFSRFVKQQTGYSPLALRKATPKSASQ